MENQQNSAQRKKRTAGRVLNRTVRAIVGVTGLLLLATLLTAFGWLFFLCWIWDHRRTPPCAIRQDVRSGTEPRSQAVPE